jgi:hypothetical protein
MHTFRQQIFTPVVTMVVERQQHVVAIDSLMTFSQCKKLERVKRGVSSLARSWRLNFTNRPIIIRRSWMVALDLSGGGTLAE